MSVLVAFLITALIATGYFIGCLMVDNRQAIQNMAGIVWTLTIVTWILYFIQ